MGFCQNSQNRVVELADPKPGDLMSAKVTVEAALVYVSWMMSSVSVQGQGGVAWGWGGNLTEKSLLTMKNLR